MNNGQLDTNGKGLKKHRNTSGFIKYYNINFGFCLICICIYIYIYILYIYITCIYNIHKFKTKYQILCVLH